MNQNLIIAIGLFALSAVSFWLTQALDTDAFGFYASVEELEDSIDFLLMDSLMVVHTFLPKTAYLELILGGCFLTIYFCRKWLKRDVYPEVTDEHEEDTSADGDFLGLAVRLFDLFGWRFWR